MTTGNEIKDRLEKLAYRKSIPFCYPCYVEASSGCCPVCHTDDLARLVKGNGMDWGVEWIIESLLRENLNQVDADESFEESINGCYPETTKVAWGEFDTISILKTMDPISWEIAQNEWLDAEIEDGNIVTYDNGSTHYWTHDVEAFLDKSEEDAA